MDATAASVNAELERRSFMLDSHPENVEVNERIAELDVKTATARVARDEAQWRLVEHKHSAHVEKRNFTA
jgi:hypothetical protein